MPGVLIVEAMAQLGGLLVSNTVDNTGKTPVLLSLDGVKIRKPVTPGDQLVLEAETIQVRARIISVRCRATVAGTLCGGSENSSCSSRRTASIDADYAMTIHPTAEVDATAHIADGCEIGPFAVVGPRSSWIRLCSSCTRGRGARHHAWPPLHGASFAVVGGDPQDLKWKGEQVSLKCGDDSLGEQAAYRGTVPGQWGHHVGKSKSHHGGEPCGTRLSHWIAVHHCQQRDVGWTCGGGRPCQLGWRGGVHHFTTIGSGAFLPAWPE